MVGDLRSNPAELVLGSDLEPSGSSFFISEEVMALLLVNASGLSKNFGFNPILDQLACELFDRERVAVVGPNGTGKSTLLRLLARDDMPDSGHVNWRKGLRIGYVSQIPVFARDMLVQTVIEGAFERVLALHAQFDAVTERLARAQTSEEMASLAAEYDRCLTRLEAEDGYQVRSRVEGIVSGFQFTRDVLQAPLGTLSGGERTKVALARALAANPECLILDEPTNHLDLLTMEWLEDYLRQYDGAVLVVSHDRYFLDRVATKVWEIESGRLTVYRGNYSDYAAERERQLLLEFAVHEDQQKKIQHMEEAIKRLRQWANQAHPPSEALHRRASSMQKALDRIVRLEKPQLDRPVMRLDLDPADQSGQEVIRINGLTKGYGDHVVLQDVDWLVRQGERVGVVGANGAGKSTLVRLITGEESPDGGDLRVGPSVKMGILSQHIWAADANPRDRVIERFRSAVPMEAGQARHYLARFLFHGDHVYRPVSSLSGGEQMRLRLAQLMCQELNTLVLDEPTNHLDIESREVLEEVLEAFTGTLIVVSHDRYLLNRRVSTIYWLEDAHLTRYMGSYDDVRTARTASMSS